MPLPTQSSQEISLNIAVKKIKGVLQDSVDMIMKG